MANPENIRTIWKDQMEEEGQDWYSFWNTRSNFAAHTKPESRTSSTIIEKVYKICSNCNGMDFRIWSTGFAAHVVNQRSKGGRIAVNNAIGR